MKYPEVKMNKDWVLKGISKDVVEWAKSFGAYLVNKQQNENGTIEIINSEKKELSTSQLRKFFGELRRIDSDFSRKKNDIVMLKPMLAYAVGRDRDKKNNKNKTRIKEFEEEMSIGIEAIRLGDEVHEKNDFKNFLKIFEAIVAYHKFYGGE